MNRRLYDTVAFRMPVTHEEFATVAGRLSNIKKHGAYLEGNVGNFKVILRSKGIYLVGSVATFLYGTNLHTLTNEEIPLAIYKLGENLGLDLFKAQVVSLDLAQTYHTRENPILYFDYLGLHQTLNRHTKIGSLYYGFRTDRRMILPKQLCFYDKNAEIKSRGHKVIKGRYLLRYELRLRRQLQKQLKLKSPVTADMLMDEQFSSFLLRVYQSEYLAIKKEPYFIGPLDLKKTVTPTQTSDLLLAKLLVDRLKKSPDFLNELYTKAKACSIYKQNVYYKRLKERFEDLLSKYTFNETSHLIMELDEKILSSYV